MITKIPKEVIEVLQKIEEAGYEAYIVGGCVRYLLMADPDSQGPSDWDVTTNAKPEEIQEIFPDSFYENAFGTVGVKVDRFTPGEGEHDVIEVTTYRIEAKYSDKRRPDAVQFAKTLEEDLSRRDFTMNALAIKLKVKSQKSKAGLEVIDLYGGQEDIKNKIIRTVGNPEERFDEDALRMMRAVRFHAQLGFAIEEKTLAAIKKFSGHMQHISAERNRK